MKVQTNQPLRIGEILMQMGVLSAQQVFEITMAQKKRCVPFGVLAEEMFDVTVDSVEKAWVEQYCQLSGEIDLGKEAMDPAVRKIISRRQAWQFEIFPLRFEPTGELLVAASRQKLARSVAFVAHTLKDVVYMRVAPYEQIRMFLRLHYPMPEVTPELLARAKTMAWTMESKV